MNKRVQFYLKQEVNGEEITRDRLDLKRLHEEERESILDYHQKTGNNIFTWNDVFGADSLLGRRWSEVKVGAGVAIDRWSLPYAMHSITATLDDKFLGKVRRRVTRVIAINDKSYMVEGLDYPFDISSRVSTGAGRRTCQLTLLLLKEAAQTPAVQNTDELPLLALLKG